MSHKIDEQVVRHIAHLSRLALSDEEIAQFGAQLGGILQYIDKLGEVNTDGVEPATHTLPIAQGSAADEPVEPLGVDKALANAPSREGSFFRVPKVLDQESA